MTDAINPSHYKQGKVECIDAIESATVHKTGLEAVCVANVIKYLFRYETKNGLTDVKKAQWYLNKLIAYLEAKEKKPIQHFEPQTITDPLDNMPCIPTPHYPYKTADMVEEVKIYNAPQDIVGKISTYENGEDSKSHR